MDKIVEQVGIDGAVSLDRHTPQHNQLKQFFLLALKTFILDLIYLVLVVGVLFNVSYFLFFLVAQPLLLVVEDVYVVQQMQGLSLEQALDTVAVPLTTTQFWTMSLEMILIVVVSFALFFFFSAYFKSKVWSLLCERKIDVRHFVWPNTVFSFSALLLLTMVFFLFQEPVRSYLFLILFFVCGAWFTFLRYFYHNELRLKSTAVHTLRALSLLRNPYLIFVSLLSAVFILFLANLPLLFAAQPVIFFGTSLVSLVLFSFIRTAYVSFLRRHSLPKDSDSMSSILRNKKAQVTTFIVVGLVILIVTGVIIYSISVLSGDETENFKQEVLETPNELLPVRNYVQDCLADAGKQALLLLGKQGGYISIENAEQYLPGTSFEYSVSRPYESDALALDKDGTALVPYWFYLDNPKDCVDCELSSAQIPNLQEMEQQIAHYVEQEFSTCIGNFIELKRQGYEITEFAPPVVTATINKDDVSITASYPLSVKKGVVEATMQLFSEDYPVQLFDLYALSYLMTAHLAQSQTLENNFLLNLITLNSGSQYGLLPPIADSTDDPYIVTWDKKIVALQLKQLLQTYGSALHFAGFKNSQRYVFNDSLEQGFYDALSITVFNDSSTILPYRATIITPDVPLYFSISPPAGEGTLRPEVQKTEFPLPTLAPFQRNLYEFFYTVSFPIVIELRDDDSFNGEGYSFFFAYEVNIRDNKDLVQWNQGKGTLRFDRSNITFSGTPILVDARTPHDPALDAIADELRNANIAVNISEISALGVALSKKKLFAFPEQRISANITILTNDRYNGTALEGVAVEFLCGTYASLSLGETILSNSTAGILTQLPLCFGDGRFEFRAEGYQTYTLFNQTIRQDTPLTIGAELERVQTVSVVINKKIKATPRFPDDAEIRRIQDLPFLTNDIKNKLIQAKMNAPAALEEFVLDNSIEGQEEAIILLDRVPDAHSAEPFAVSTVKSGSREAHLDLIPGDYKLQIILFDYAGRTIQPKMHEVCWDEGVIIEDEKCETYWVPTKVETFSPWIMGGVEFNNQTCGEYVHIAASDLYSGKKLQLNTLFFADPVVLQDLGQSGNIAQYTTQSCTSFVPEFR